MPLPFAEPLSCARIVGECRQCDDSQTLDEMLDQDGRLNRADYEQDCSGKHRHDERRSPGTKASRPPMRGHGDPDTGPTDGADNQGAKQVGQADHQAAKGQFCHWTAGQFDPNPIQFSDREREPEQCNAEEETPFVHLTPE